jgi:hypothetical protein
VKRLLLLVLLLPVLGGCASIPLVPRAVLFVVDKAPLLVIGKTVTDVAISGVIGQDCALHRVVTEREVCELVEIGETFDPFDLAGVKITSFDIEGVNIHRAGGFWWATLE